ncbi:MAG: glutamine amidotransferase [Oscillospiraceae bacterium]|nr:glutamine amidotransferase [Oscillospiraceae bacterium]
MELKICHLYPDALNLYGDGGNITCLRQRLAWRGIDVSVEECCVGDTPQSDFDLYFIGAGQSFEQGILLEDLMNKKAPHLRSACRDGKTFLAICGGMELMGMSCKGADGAETDFAGVVDIHTENGSKRLIGDYVFSCEELDGLPVVAFENHPGRLYLGSDVRPLGKVLCGHGNNGEDGLEGVRYANFFGSYGHGCLLPKNPALADHILKTALTAKYGSCDLAPLDDSFENSAREFMLKRLLAK